MKKGYIKMNLLGEKYYIRKDVVLEMIRKHPEEVLNYIDKESLTAAVIDALIDEYEMNGYDDEEEEINYFIPDHGPYMDLKYKKIKQ